MFWAGPGYDVVYRTFWLEVSLCMMEMQRAYCSTDPNQLLSQQARLTELVSTHEGVLPINDASFVLHQFFDMLKSIHLKTCPKFGVKDQF